MKLIDSIQKIEDIKVLNKSELEQLATEIREFLVDSLSKTGGHLASNLGVVELTLALHRVFDSPKDKIIWDVGHQAYVHKILTGRKNQFDTLRQLDGLSGFPKRHESQHDIFDVGHSSTSISAGLGLALARDLKGEKSHVISVIGDGAMTAGMSYEAMNHLGDIQTKMIIVLNDNEMSIDKNVGGMARHFNRLRTEPGYHRIKVRFKNNLIKFPGLVKTIEKLKSMVKYVFVPGIIFEEMGIKYIGPVDGHDIQELEEALERAKHMTEPVLIHIVTKKGKGFRPAEENPENYHGVGAFDKHTGEPYSKADNSYSEVLGRELEKITEAHREVVAITAAMASGTGLNGYKENYPANYFDVGIAEQHGVTLAAGMSVAGLKPYFVVYSSFLQRGYDQVLHDVCIQDLPVVFAIDRAGFVGNDGETHHGVFDISYLSHMPNMTIISPKDKREFIDMIHFTYGFNHPIAIRYPRGKCEMIDFNKEYEPLNFGKAECICRGNKIAVLACGDMVYESYEAIQQIKKEKAEDITLINMRFIKPIDEEMIAELCQTHEQLITVENNAVIGGMGQMVNAYILKQGVSVKIKNIGVPDRFIHQGSINELKEKCGMNQAGIYEAIIKAIEEK